MQYTVVEKTKGLLEVELDDKTMASILFSELTGSGVDAENYEPHPLFPVTRLKIKSANPEKDLKAAVASTEKKVAKLKKTVL